MFTLIYDRLGVISYHQKRFSGACQILVGVSTINAAFMVQSHFTLVFWISIKQYTQYDS